MANETNCKCGRPYTDHPIAGTQHEYTPTKQPTEQSAREIVESCRAELRSHYDSDFDTTIPGKEFDAEMSRIIRKHMEIWASYKLKSIASEFVNAVCTMEQDEDETLEHYKNRLEMAIASTIERKAEQ